MDITTILNKKGPAAAVAAAEVHFHQLAQAVHLDSRTSSDMGSEHGASQAEHPVLTYPPSAPSLHQMANIPQGMRFAPPSHQSNGVPMMQSAYMHEGFGNPQMQNGGAPQPRSEPAPKTFHCQTCGKGFARRSDLARHGEYYSGGNLT